MKKLYIGIVLVLLLATMAGCTEQQRAKKWGGDYTVELPAGQKLVNVTFKDSDLWYLTRPMTEEDKAETYTFQEDSTWGVMEGTVTIKEHKE
jgi:hypothetical protein